MTLIFYKVIAAALIFIISIAIAIYPLKKKTAPYHPESAHLGDALASGIFLGAAFFHMLPDAIKMFNHLYGEHFFPLPEAICVLGFLFLLFLERLSLAYSAFQAKNTVPYLLAAILIVHAVTEGAALGISTTLPETSMLLIAILAHKGSESFALCVTLLKHQLPFKRVVKIILFFAFMTPLGIGLGTAINLYALAGEGELMAATFNAFAAGTFLYISTLHHIHFHKHTEDSQGLLEFASLAGGVVVMGVIALWN